MTVFQLLPCSELCWQFWAIWTVMWWMCGNQMFLLKSSIAAAPGWVKCRLSRMFCRKCCWMMNFSSMSRHSSMTCSLFRTSMRLPISFLDETHYRFKVFFFSLYVWRVVVCAVDSLISEAVLASLAIALSVLSAVSVMLFFGLLVQLGVVGIAVGETHCNRTVAISMFKFTYRSKSPGTASKVKLHDTPECDWANATL